MSTIKTIIPKPKNQGHQIQQLVISSPAFANQGVIPQKYTTNGDNVNPPISIANIPPNTKSLVLIVETDCEKEGCVHWMVWNIPPKNLINENSVPGVQGVNDFWQNDYEGPFPPKGNNHYFFKVFALDCMLNLPANTSRRALDVAMKNHILTYGQLIGTYNWIANCE